MRETRRTKEWLTPEILEKSYQEQQLVAREAFETSDNIGVPIEAEKNALWFVPTINDIISSRELFDKRFFQMFFMGIAVSGLLALLTLGTNLIHWTEKTDWNSLYNAGKSLTWAHRYDEAEICYKRALEMSDIDNAERSATYGELARLAQRKGNEKVFREFSIKSDQTSQLGFGLALIIMSMIILFVISACTVFILSKSNGKMAAGWHQPLAVCATTYAVSAGIHNIIPSIPWFVLTAAGAMITYAILVFSAICDGSMHAQFVTPNRD